MEILIGRGDITTAETEAIVTAANRSLVGGGGVDGAVHRAAGPGLLSALRPLAPCPPGQAVVTDAFDLPGPIRWVIHAVGPRYGVDDPAANLLASAYDSAIRQCDEVGARSVAFPSLSTGAYHYPLLDACQISIRAILAAQTSLEVCRRIAFDSKTEKFWKRALDQAR